MSPMLRLLLAAILGMTLATASAEESRVSRPGEYRGYGEASYDGHQLVSVYVTVRDGTRLAVDVFLPTRGGKLAEDKLPVVWMHTPYNRRTTNGGLTAANYPGKALQLVKYGYAVAVADFRGLYASFGRNAGYNRGEWQDAARFDAYDITEWLAKQPWSNGKVGMWGCSATGGSQMQALTTAPPSLKAIFPMSCEWDVYAFVAAGGITPREGPTMMMRGGSREERDRNAVAVDGDTDAKLLAAAVADHAHNLETAGFVPFRDSRSAEFGNAWWLLSSPHSYAEAINRSRIAVYAAVNWAEGFTGHGPAYTFNNLRTPKKLILGPGKHCDWATVLTDTGFDIVTEERRFFDHWLRGIDNGVMREPAVTYYTYNAARERAWRTSPTWPPRATRTAFYLADGALRGEPPAGANAGGAGATRKAVSYDTDAEAFWSTGMTFVTEPLAQDTEVTGHPTARLWLSSTAKDADIVARIDDLAPDGTHIYVGVEGKLRASLRATAPAPYETMGLPWHPFTAASAQPLEPGVPVQAEFEFLPTSYIFKAGHRIRLALQFADPRSTQKLAPAPVVTLLHRADAASMIELPVVTAADERAAAAAEQRARLDAIPDTAGSGAWPALKEEVASLPDHVVYRPARLDEFGKTGKRKLGVYIFGNGACSDDGASARLHLLEIASHGYLAIAPGRIRSGPGATAAPTPPRAPSPGDDQKLPKPPTTSADLLSALDWALAQNRDPGSPYHGRIDPRAIAISGFSCGGLQALQIASDPRVKTLVVMNSGIFNDGKQGISGIDVSKSLLDRIHTPTLYILGGETDIAYANGMDDVSRIKHVPAYVGNLIGVGHGGSYWQPNGGKAAAAVVAWLDWQLRGDKSAAKTFVGKDCGLCTDPAWQFRASR
ncbi:MAG TPA: CocE/NonD family hydrolase [Steroidobacteraceae bacterium]|nr:CocE/NonD family hydrolase [Steroidobacteraceae bacterium]